MRPCSQAGDDRATRRMEPRRVEQPNGQPMVSRMVEALWPNRRALRRSMPAAFPGTMGIVDPAPPGGGSIFRCAEEPNILTPPRDREEIEYPFERVRSPIQVGKLRLRNRLVFASMETNLANSDGTVSKGLVEFIRARAQGGVGLVITENTAVDPAARPFPSTRIGDDEFISGLSWLCRAVHRERAAVFIQLDHRGVASSDRSGGTRAVAPPAVRPSNFGAMPWEMTREEIHQTIEDFVLGAVRAQKAGADGVEIQAAHGFLVHRFLSPRTNNRLDAFGQGLVGRARLIVEILNGIKDACGPDFAISCRVSAEDFVGGGLTLEHTMPTARLMARNGADMIHVSAGVIDSPAHVVPPASPPDAPHGHFAEAIRSVVGIPVIAVGKIPDLETAERLLEHRKADLVAFGRSLLADPDLPAKELVGRGSEVLRCERCNSCLEKILGSCSPVACKLHSSSGGIP